MTIENTLINLTDAINRIANLFDDIGDEESRQLVFDFVKQQGSKPMEVHNLDKGNGESKSAPKKKRRRRRTKAEMQAAREAEARAKAEAIKKEAEKIVDEIIDEGEGKNLASDSVPTIEHDEEEDVDFYLKEKLEEKLESGEEFPAIIKDRKSPLPPEIADRGKEVKGTKPKDEEKVPESMDEIVEAAIEANTDPLADITLNDVRGVVRELIFRQMNNEARTVLAKYGVRKVADLPQDKWEQCYDELKALLEKSIN